MKKPETWKLVMGCNLTAKSDISRDDWRTYVHRYLLPEIHAETLRFYGEDSSAEALHPGFDYTNLNHRARLTAFPQHKRLFGVFDKLKLTDCEIQALCKWAGTLAAKEQFERQNTLQIRDTTWDGVLQFDKETPSAHISPKRNFQPTLIHSRYMPDAEREAIVENAEGREYEGGDQNAIEETEDESEQSFGPELNQRLMDGTMDADWEQWMKEALERGDIQRSPEASHSQTLRTLARLNNQRQAQMLRDTRFAHSTGSILSGRNEEQPHRLQTREALNTNDTTSDFSRPPSLLRSFSPPDQSQQPIQPRVDVSIASTQPNSRPPDPSRADDFSTSPYALTSRPGHHSSTAQINMREGEAPEILSNHSRSHIATLRELLSHPPQYPHFYPSARMISAPGRNHGPAAPSAPLSASVPT